MHATLEVPSQANGRSNGHSPVQLALLPNNVLDLARDWNTGNRAVRMEVGRRAQKLLPEECQQLVQAIEAKGDIPSPGIRARAALAARPAKVIPPGPFNVPAPVTEENAAESESKCRREKVQWDEAEWLFVVNGVARMRMEQPSESLTSLTETIISHMPPDRQRPVNGVVTAMPPKLAEYYQQHFLKLDAENQRLKARLDAMEAAPTKEEILCTLTREEICERYASDVLADLSADDLIVRYSSETILSCIPTPALVAAAMQRTLENFSLQSSLFNDNLQMMGRLLAEMPAEKIAQQQRAIASAGVKLPHVALVGFKGDQGAVIADALKGRAKIEIIDKNRKRFESGADVIILWARFVSHAMQNSIRADMKPTARLIVHNAHDEYGGGLKAAINEIKRALDR